MRNRFIGSIFSVGLTLAVAGAVAVVWVTEERAQGQARGGAQNARPAYRAPRTPDGKPNLNGIWQALDSASFDIEDHAAKPSPVVQMGALGAIPAGIGIVEGGEIPYRPEALAKKKQNAAKAIDARSGGEVLHAGRAARDLHAVPLPDRPDALAHPHGV